MMIGANDLFLLLDSCAGDLGCVTSGIPGLLDTLKTNLITIYSGLRQSGFHGEFVAVTYYSLDYSDPVGTGVVAAIDGVLAGVTQGIWRQGRRRFRRVQVGGGRLRRRLLRRRSAHPPHGDDM